MPGPAAWTRTANVPVEGADSRSQSGLVSKLAQATGPVSACGRTCQSVRSRPEACASPSALSAMAESSTGSMWRTSALTARTAGRVGASPERGCGWVASVQAAMLSSRQPSWNPWPGWIVRFIGPPPPVCTAKAGVPEG